MIIAPQIRKWTFVFGLFMMPGIFLVELYFGIAASGVYVLLSLGVLALSRTPVESMITGIIPTVLLFTGILSGIHDQLQVPDIYNYINDSIGIITIWISVLFTIRYRKSIKSEIRNREMIKSLFECANEAIIVVNEKGLINMVNPAVEKTFGYPVRELINQKIEILVPDKYREIHQNLRDKFIIKPNSRSMAAGVDLYGKRKDGVLVPISVSISPFTLDHETYVVAFVLDITEMKAAEFNLRALNEELENRVVARTEELSNSIKQLEDLNGSLENEIKNRLKYEMELQSMQQMYAAVTQNFPNGWIGILDENLVYIFASGKGIVEASVNTEELVGKTFTDEGENNDIHNLLKQGFSDGATKIFEIKCRGHTCEVTALPFINSHDGDEILVVVHDITKQKARQIELINALHREKELGEMKSKFVSLASHEFRTPLTTILSSIYLLENYSGEQFESMKGVHFGRIKRSATLLNEILDDFLSLSKLEENKIYPSYSEIELQSFLSDFVSDMRNHKRPDQTINYDCKNNVVIHSDKKLLYNILSNLVSNAIKYSGDKGLVEIVISTHHHSLNIQVKDNGVGIPIQDQKNLFERFYRANNVNHIQGTGLGLNITKKYIELLGGSIEFESAPGDTVFTVKIPL